MQSIIEIVHFSSNLIGIVNIESKICKTFSFVYLDGSIIFLKMFTNVILFYSIDFL